MKVVSSDKARFLFLTAGEGEPLVDALTRALRDEVVTAGWVRGSGDLRNVVLRGRKLDGEVQAISIEGSVSLGDDVQVKLRGVLARETDAGLQTLGGEILSADVVRLELFVIAVDEAEEPATWQEAARAVAAAPPPPPEPRPAAPPQQPQQPQASLQAVIPPRIVSRPNEYDHGPTPEAGDVVDHFAFGRCEVLKSDGDRLHLRMQKDQRIKEIALEMLKITPLPDEDGKRRYKLDRRI
jgi:predicted DNA-binding protein with PD1-like motif